MRAHPSASHLAYLYYALNVHTKKVKLQAQPPLSYMGCMRI